ncbi:GTP 3',8-cyclase MoaA [Bradyrhizobium sp. AUGA SZCCT0177]|uniref:GTP 3',8-cyclase MoaA n=1 Tax=Bradyrhizobium sp. AUGA SZCCT0177 TaxID=2807665 RepID=UPI001BAB7DC9|nr:GTP 3',8-cyclase MoaA [Bradyrhizobium sp. AUGA SZCCT0177]MBR1281250.1 GTP 3',8-cyclase MoaA [Bradyrhizobium sp. AUGA SZCCT0177]
MLLAKSSPNAQPLLTDNFGRSIEYLRISVTDRCDLRCTYCIPKGFRNFNEPASWLTFEEITRLVSVMAHNGLRRVRLTGGEPLLRRNLPSLVRRLAQIDEITDISLSTNGTRLAALAAELRDAGVSRINVSLDTLKAERNEALNGRDVFRQVLDGLLAAKKAGFHPIKINMVALKGQNDSEIDDMVEFCAGHGFVLRLIEAMPMGVTGRNASHLDLQPVRERLKQKHGLVESRIEGGGPARYLASKDGRVRIGFITPISEHFCATCNRVRLAVNGTMYLCLGQNEKFEFAPLLRGGASDAQLLTALADAMALKPERHEFLEKPDQIGRIMSVTGG